MGRIVRVISEDAAVVCSAIDGRDIVGEIERIHKTSAVVTAALGRLAMGTSLIGFGLKGENDSVTVRINGGGPIGGMTAVSDSAGNVKCCCDNSVVELPLKPNGKLDVGAAVGRDGTISVVKDLGLKEPYVGQTELVSGEIAEDITNYFAVSEQTPTVCALGVLVNPDLSVKCAGGFIIQLLPFASDECIDVIEKNIAKMSSVTSLLESGMTATDIAMLALDGLKPNKLDDFEVSYRCTCSRERTKRILYSLNKKDIESLAEDEVTEVKCHFCGASYKFSREEILELLKK
ncbi:MAG TPA: Hsp33 family molecular chaperone HslO [Candidatus Faeciplasma pullistercoris]|uniref:33 kDa chaperonin n=1 Tax=Candidatus Faeciplasma pullistercoris TaxID=2840800 RepID=A0A9D1GTG4_9FIRM|nr:Hsp33 family molecular chaperone HslO [Candidatus Faeciplasma pullistercoris]